MKSPFVVRPDGTIQAYFEMKGPDGQWYRKRSINTFFPEKWTEAHIEAAAKVLNTMKVKPGDPLQVDLEDGTR